MEWEFLLFAYIRVVLLILYVFKRNHRKTNDCSRACHVKNNIFAKIKINYVLSECKNKLFDQERVKSRQRTLKDHFSGKMSL